MSKSFEIDRVYNKRETEKSAWSGHIGGVKLTLSSKADIEVTLDGKPLGANAINHLLNFALQTLQDAYAGAASLAEAKGAFEKKRDAILEGTIGVRQSGDGESEELRVSRKIMAEKLRAKFKGTEKWAVFEALGADERNAKLDELFAKNREALASEVSAEIARLAEMRKAKAQRLATTVEIDL